MHFSNASLTRVLEASTMRHSLHRDSMKQTVRMKSAVCNGPKIYLDWYKLLLNKYTIGQVSIIYSAETNK